MQALRQQKVLTLPQVEVSPTVTCYDYRDGINKETGRRIKTGLNSTNAKLDESVSKTMGKTHSVMCYALEGCHVGRWVLCKAPTPIYFCT